MEKLVANGTFVPDLVIPEGCNTGSAEVVSTRCGNWSVEHVQTDQEQEKLSSDQEVIAEAIPRHRPQGLRVEQRPYLSDPMTGRRSP